MPTLLRAKDVAGAAQLQVAHGQRKAGAHLAELLDRPQPPGRLRRKVTIFFHQQIAICAVLVPPHSASQLVQVCQAISIGVINEHRVRIRNIEPAFYNRRGQQNIDLAAHETQHHVFQLMLRHLPVADVDPSFRHDLGQPRRHPMDIVDTIVNKINLARRDSARA